MDTVTTARQALMIQVRRARTLGEIAAAGQALSQWMQSHPEDRGMRDGFGHLALRQEIAQEKQRAEEPQPVGQAA